MIFATKTPRHQVISGRGVVMDLSAFREEWDAIGRQIVDSAFAVHKELGPGLLESVYEVCFCHELNKRGLAVRRQVIVPFVYDGLHFDEGLRLDVLVEEAVVCELKAADHHPVFQAQLLSQLRLSGKRLGYLINFNVPIIKNGIKRMSI
jgi:GxxExxY protein